MLPLMVGACILADFLRLWKKPFPMTKLVIFIGQEWVLVSALLALIIIFFYTETKKLGPSVSVHELTLLVNRENASIIDIRDEKEFREGHIVDAVNIPFAKFQGNLKALEKYKNAPLIIVDKMGQHSGSISKQLKQDGYDCRRLQGGITEWKANNLPVIT
ncbi:MAG: rhodanese-like domain-containing protein [Pseudomonadales bacterium]|nr:rhodanese-like domain-containing protein [Pseudomonadales bacterium]